MHFLILSNTNIQFAQKELNWRSYTIEKALSIIWQVELIGKKEFALAALDENIEAFMLYLSSLSLRLKMLIDPAQKAQIALMLAKKVTVVAEYTDFADVFLKKFAKVLPKCTNINKYIMKLKKSK